MAVNFERYGLLHYLDPGEDDYGVGDWVLYPTAEGPEVAQCVWAPEEVDSKSFSELPRCLGKARPEDLERDRTNRRIRAEARRTAEELVVRHQLPMKIVVIDYLDRSAEFDRQVVIYFTAPRRVDFRTLLGDLAGSLKARIDLRQIAMRDAARLIGGIGSCGREFCCTTFIDELEPISMRLAKAQFASTNPLQITGGCGKLLCCLRYEHPLYLDFARNAPQIGDYVELPDGEGRVVGHRAPDGTVTLKLTDGNMIRRCAKSMTSRVAKKRVE